MNPLVPMFASTVVAATPLIYAALGETIVEKAGVLNLGIEGMMLIGAVAGFAATLATGSDTLGFLAAAGAGVALSLAFGFLTLNLQTNQVATGLALTLFGIGLSAFVGHNLAGTPLPPLPSLTIPGLTSIPVVGDLFFHYDIMVYLSLVLFAGVQWFVTRSHAGLTLRAIGESPTVAHAIGKPVLTTRYLAVMFGGAWAGHARANI
jgi:ABC-type uncharacterized transport system permease subunit